MHPLIIPDDHIVNTAIYWTTSMDKAGTLMGSLGNGLFRTVQVKELAELDERLGVLILKLIDDHKNTVVHKAVVLRCIDYWNSIKYTFLEYGVLWEVNVVHSIIDINDSTVELFAMLHDTAELALPSGEAVAYSKMSASAALNVKKSWMDETYPGWESRALCAVSLGCEEDILTRTVFGGQACVQGVDFAAGSLVSLPLSELS